MLEEHHQADSSVDNNAEKNNKIMTNTATHNLVVHNQPECNTTLIGEKCRAAKEVRFTNTSEIIVIVSLCSYRYLTSII